MPSGTHMQPTRLEHAQAVETTSMPEVEKTVPLLIKHVGTVGKLAILGVCRQKLRTKPETTMSQTNPPSQKTSSLTIPSDHSSQATLSNLGDVPFTPAPRIKIYAVTPYGQANVEALPDSGADVCAAGPLFIQALGENLDNLAYSDITPRTVNGTILHPIGKIPEVTFCLQGRKAKTYTSTPPYRESLFLGTLHKLLASYQWATHSPARSARSISQPH